MSYDVYMYAVDGRGDTHRCSESFNYTSNCAEMWKRALGGSGLRGLENMQGRDASILLTKAICHMASRPEVYKAMEPENGWGDYHGAMNFLVRILQICKENPTSKVGMSY